MSIWWKNLDVRFIFSNTKDSGLNELQKENFEFFKKNELEISDTCLKFLLNYLIKIRPEIRPDFNEGELNIESIKNIVKPRYIIFNKDGSFGVLCVFEWDIEHGVGIQVKPSYLVGPQDILI